MVSQDENIAFDTDNMAFSLISGSRSPIKGRAAVSDKAPKVSSSDNPVSTLPANPTVGLETNVDSFSPFLP